MSILFKRTALAAAIGLASSTSAIAGTVTTDGPDIKIKTKGGLQIATADDQFSFKVGGRLQYDYNRAELNGEPDENDLAIRRARLAFSGHAGDWAYKTQFNVGESAADAGTVEDLYIRYTGFGKTAIVTLGKQNEPFGLERLTSSNDIAVLERSATTEMYTFGRNTGIQVSGAAGNLFYGVGVFEQGDDRDADDVALTGRVAFAPVNESGNVVHTGVNFSYRGSARMTVDGNDFDFNDQQSVGVELAAVSGPFHAQAEWMSWDADVDAVVQGVSTSGVSEDMDSYYVQLGWILTGETRPYKNGVFKRVKSAEDCGAWELVLRYEDGEANYSDIELGRDDASSITVGINWYLNDNLRFGINFTDGDSNTNDNDGREVRVRTQFTF